MRQSAQQAMRPTLVEHATGYPHVYNRSLFSQAANSGEKRCGPSTFIDDGMSEVSTGHNEAMRRLDSKFGPYSAVKCLLFVSKSTTRREQGGTVWHIVLRRIAAADTNSKGAMVTNTSQLFPPRDWPK